MKILLRFTLFILMVFLTCVTLMALWKLPLTLSPSARFLLGGILTGTVVFGLLVDFKRIYIIGHELSHWLVAKIFRRKTGKFSIAKNGGSVQIANPNIWILLAPYFIPFYSLFCIPLWFILKYIVRDFPYKEESFFVILGLSFAYHFVMTFKALRQEQTDLKKYGVLFSLCMITCLNSLLIYGITALCNISLWQSVKIWAQQALRLIELMAHHASNLLSLIQL